MNRSSNVLQKSSFVSLLFLIAATFTILILTHKSSANFPSAGFLPAANEMVKAIKVQSDGKIVVGGWYTTI